MAQRALWRNPPDDPRAPFGWFLADADARPLSPWSATVLALGLVAFAVMFSAWVLLAMPLLALATRIPRRPCDLTPLRTIPPPGPALACRASFWVDSLQSHLAPGTLVGTDEGIATFVDGWLHYAGHRAEFALRRSDVRDDARVGSRWTLWLDGDTGLTLEPLDDRNDDFFGRAFRVWANGTPVPSGDSILPPIHVHPSGLARAWWQVLLTLAALLAMAGLLLAFQYGMMLFFFAGGGWTAFRRLRRLRSLAHEERLLRLKGRTA